MKIGELGRATGFKDKTIRYYERQGLLPDPGRTSSGYRAYGPEDVDRLQFVGKAKRLGLSLEEIRGILRVHDQREATCSHVCGLLDQKLAQTDALIHDLQTFRKELAQLRKGADATADCRPAGGRICGIIENSSFGAGQETMTWIRSPGMRAE
ncbi:MAG: heavy metal-responsive transcriptional regulator [Chloroflexi bacterium]|nr:heavy metal-responsive transcriptional regulator [Chloroflexota bacterium]